MAGEYVNDDALDALLQWIIDNAEQCYVNSQAPTTHTEASSTYALSAAKAVTVGAVGAGTPSGRDVDVPELTAVSINQDGTATHVSLTKDTVTVALVAVTDLSASQVVSNGNTATIATWTVTVTDAA